MLIVGPHLLHVSLSVVTGECLAQAKGASIHISTCMVAELVLRLQVGVSRLWPCRRPRPRICRSWPRWSRWLCNKREWEALEEEEELDNQEEGKDKRTGRRSTRRLSASATSLLDFMNEAEKMTTEAKDDDFDFTMTREASRHLKALWRGSDCTRSSP